MQRAFADEAEQRTFCDELLQMLRRGEPEAALEHARSRLRSVEGISPLVAERALMTRVEDITLTGWDKLAPRIQSAEEYGNEPVTALGIDFSWPGHFASAIRDGKAVLDYDTQGGFAPVLETNYYGDMRKVKFSTATRDEILGGYSSFGSEWQGGFIDIDNLIGVKGMAPLYGAIQACGPRNADTAEGDACVLAASISAILLHLAVKRTIETRGLPKPMAVLVGSNEDFPFFDAPVMSVDETHAHARPFEHHSGPIGAAQGSAESSQRRAKRDRPSVNVLLKEHPEFTDFAKLAEQSLRHVRKPKDVLPALGNLAASALADFVCKRR
ncbi:MAG: hypothetical protein HC870_02155 [Rhizobiales bacterium]|nr:hypothetical protein [Hyphomicrobiales bacterium]